MVQKHHTSNCGLKMKAPVYCWIDTENPVSFLSLKDWIGRKTLHGRGFMIDDRRLLIIDWDQWRYLGFWAGLRRSFFIVVSSLWFMVYGLWFVVQSSRFMFKVLNLDLGWQIANHQSKINNHKSHAPVVCLRWLMRWRCLDIESFGRQAQPDRASDFGSDQSRILSDLSRILSGRLRAHRWILNAEPINDECWSLLNWIECWSL